MALYMGKVKIAGSGSGGGGSYVLPEATSSTLGGVKVGMADTDEKLGVKLDPTTKQAYVTKAGGTGTCNYNYTQLSGTVENIVARKLTANNPTIQGYVTGNNPAIGTVVEDKLVANNTVLTSDISSVVKQTIAEHGSSLMNGYDLDDEGNLTIYTKVPNLSWAFNDNHFIKSISSDTLLYTTYVDYNAWGTFANLRCLDYVNLNAIKEIGNDTFYYSVISSEVSAPNCELIRCDAFRYAYIHEINFPNCLEIEDGAFYSINNWEDEYSEYSEFAEWFFFTPITFNFPKVKKVEGVAFYVGGGALSCVIHIPNAEELGSQGTSHTGTNYCFYNQDEMDIYIDGNITVPPTVVYNQSGFRTFGRESTSQKIKVHVKSSMRNAFSAATNWALFIADDTIELI